MKFFLVFIGLISVALCCTYNCPSSKRKVTNPNFKAQPNGCGTKFLSVPQFLFPSAFTRCCNNHDLCYGKCNSNKASCDNTFRNCMRGTCSDQSCRDKAETFYNAVNKFGCTPYTNAQKKACLCI